jgi:hypothetical protein
MKFFSAAFASLGLVTAASVAEKINYEDWKVYRVKVGSDASALEDVVSKLQLELWKGKPSSNDMVDIMVPPSVVADFEASAVNIETQIMHHNLGISIADEQSFGTYVGKSTLQICAIWMWR